MTPARAAWIGAAVAGGVTAVVWWLVMAGFSDGGETLVGQIAVVAFLATPLAIAGAVIARRCAVAAHGRDLSERLLGLSMAGLRESRGEWSAAMRAELASIDDSSERRRFAVGCAVTALRTGTGRAPWLIAIGTGIVFAVGVFAASRATLADGRGGIMGFTLLWPPLLLFAVTFFTALGARSLHIGLVSGVLALFAGLLGVLGSAMAEAAHWHEVAGVYLMDGDYPKGGLDRLEAVLDPLGPSFVVHHLLFWAPWPLLGAAAGSWRHHPSQEGASLAARGSV